MNLESGIWNLKSRISIIGAGRLGGALAIALERKGYEIETIVSRNLQSAKQLADKLESAPNTFESENLANFKFPAVVIIATPDPEIEPTAKKLALFSPPANTIFLHTSGAISSAALKSLQNVSGTIGSLHPLVAVSDSKLGAEKFAGAYFCLEGDAEAVKAAQEIVTALAGNAFSIPTAQKSLYHAAAVMSAGHLVALFDLAVETLADCGLEKQSAQKILLPLASSTIANLATQTPAAALTGTFARADLETMKKHLATLNGKSAFEVYVELGLRSLQLAAEHGGVEIEKIAAMRHELEKL